MSEKPARISILTAIILISVLFIFTVQYIVLARSHSLNPDEGIYGAAAACFAAGDVMLQTADTDKPPLNYQLLGLSLKLFGFSDMSLKFPNYIFVFSLFLLIFLLARRHFGQDVAVLTVALMAMSEYLAYCGIGAMTDPPAVFFLTASTFLALNNRLFWAGFLFGMALLTRQMALLYFPLIIAAAGWEWWPQGKRWRALWRTGLAIAKGATIPFAWLMIWSAFFQREPFRWFWQEMFSGKVTMGADEAGMAGRLLFWLGELNSFFLSRALILIAVVCGLVVYVRLRKTIEGREKFILLLFGAAAIYYPLIHAIMGAPLYRRMMFPALPLILILAAYPVIKVLKMVFRRPGPWEKAGASVLLLALTALGALSNSHELKALRPWDDTPEVAQYLNQYRGRPSAVHSTGLNRELMFYLYGNDIRRKQFGKNTGLLNRNIGREAGKKQFVVFRQNEMPELLEKAKAALPPVYKIEPVKTTARELFSIFEVVPKAGIYQEQGATYILKPDGENMIALSVTEDRIEQSLARYVKARLAGKGAATVDVTIDDDNVRPDGCMESLDIELSDVKVKSIRAAKIVVRYKHPCVDLEYLLGAWYLVLKSYDSATGHIEVDEEELSAFIQKKNKNIKDMKFEITTEGALVSGKAEILGKQIPFFIAGNLEAGPDGAINFEPTKGRFGDHNLPGFVLKLIGKQINPTFYAKVDSLGLAAKGLSFGTGRLIFELQK